MSRPVCVHCGKPYAQRDTHTVTLRWGPGEEEPHYQGNLQIVKRGDVRRNVNLDKRCARDVEVWNGSAWFGGYEPFCTLRCALDYARAAYRNRKESNR